MLTIEVGGSSVQAILFEDNGSYRVVPISEHRDDEWAFAAPGLVDGDRVRGAHHTGWMNSLASEELGMARPPLLGMNDAEASALGEWVLQGRLEGRMFYVVMGTGIGGMMVQDGQLIPVEFGHLPGFGSLFCGGCLNHCLDAQIGGHALPTPLTPQDINHVVRLLHEAMERAEVRADRMVLAGGVNRRYPQIRERLSPLVDFPIVPSRTPKGLKSAAPFGLRHTLGSRQ